MALCLTRVEFKYNDDYIDNDNNDNKTIILLIMIMVAMIEHDGQR